MVVRFLAAKTANKPVAGIRAGTVAVWDAGPSGTDWSPAIDPLNNLSKVKFHSDFDYLRIKKVVSSRDAGRSPVSLPLVNIFNTDDRDFTLFAHGLGHMPLIIASIECNGNAKQPTAGTVIPNNGVLSDYMRFVGFTADATNVYMHCRGSGAREMTIHWTVYVLEESFQTLTSPLHMLRFEKGSADIGALGKIDPAYMFARKAAGTGEFRFLGKPSIVFDTQSNGGAVTCLQYCDGAFQKAAPTVVNFTPTATYSITGTECNAIPAASDGVAHGFAANASGLSLRTSDGKVIYSSAWSMLAVLKRVSGTLSIPAHSPTGSAAARTQTDYDVGAAPAGTLGILGWGQITNATNFPAAKAFDFSGTVVTTSGIYRYTSAWATVMPFCQMLSPVVSGGRILVRDDWFSLATTSGAYNGFPPQTIPARSLDYDLRCVAFVGGN